MQRLSIKIGSRQTIAWPCLVIAMMITHSFFNAPANADEATDQWVTKFAIQSASASHNGKYLLAICKKVGEEDKDNLKMVLFDLDRRRQLKVVETARPKHFGIDNERIFLVSQGSKTLKVLDLKTFKERTSIELQENILDMTLINQRRVGLLLEKDHINAVAYFDKETLKRDEYLEVNESFSGVHEAFPYSDAYYRTRTDLKDRVSDEHICVVSPPMLQVFATRKNPAPVTFPDSGENRMSLSALYPHRGTVMGRADRTAWGRARAAAESMNVWNWRRGRNGEDEFILTRTADEVWTVSRLAEDNLNSWFQFLVFRKRDVVFISNQVLTYIPRKPLAPDHKLRFVREPIVVFDTADIAKIQLSCEGGVGKKIWANVNESPHAWIDETTGMLTVDTPSIWAEHLSVVSAPASRYLPLNPKQTATEFRRITGTAVPEDKIPFYVPVDFRVEDSKLQRVEASLYLLVLAPKADYAVAKSVTPVTEGITGIVGDALDAMSQLKNDTDPPTTENRPTSLDQRIAATQKKADEIQSQLSRIESLVKQIRSLERGDK